MITSGRGSLQRVHRTFRRFREKEAAANEHNSQVEEERMENDVMAAAGSLHQKPRESDVMDAEGSLHQKPREVCITKDTESIDLGWFENTKLNRVKNGTLDVCYRWAFAIGNRWADIRQESKRGFGETAAEAMDAEVEGEDEIHLSKRPRVAERVAFHVPSEAEPENHDFDVNEFLRSGRNPVVASILGDSEKIQRAALRRGYPVMKSRFSNFGDDIHDQSVRERITDTIQRIPHRLVILAFPSLVWSPILNHATSSRVTERIDRERAAELSSLDWVVSSCEIQETAANMFLVENSVAATICSSRCVGLFQRLTNRLSRSHKCPAGHHCQLGTRKVGSTDS